MLIVQYTTQGSNSEHFPSLQTDSLKSSVQQVKFYETGADIFVVWGLFFLSYQVKFIPKVGKL